jgi:hypothetical protein
MVDVDGNRLPKADRNRHIHACVRREMASQQEQLQTDIHYCHHCFDWVVSGEWDDHCQSHLLTMTSKRRGTITYCHTLVRPAYCPDCLAREGLPASQRMVSWSRDRALWIHMDDHLEKYEWPRPCPDLVCTREASLRNDTGASIQRPGGPSISPHRRALIQSYAPRPPGWHRQRHARKLYPGSQAHIVERR